jgi:serine/threonine protein kinase
MVGRTVSHYEIVEKIGAGGMGVLYKARDTRLGRIVALKVLPADRVANPERQRHFVQEARAASALNHPHIVTVHDIDEADGVHFIAMEYVEGRTLADAIGRKGLPLRAALQLGARIADALARAHTQGIVHRDLKPANVMVTARGVAKVLDFGLAKLVETEASEDDTTDLRPLTDDGHQSVSWLIQADYPFTHWRFHG